MLGRFFVRFAWSFWAMLLGWAATSSPAMAQNDLDAAPIHYLSSHSQDAVADWLTRLKQSSLEGGNEDLQDADSSRSKLAYDSKLGWLPAILEHFKVPAESQTLVFSKTSLQIRYISPENPRAIFFNDDIYVGFVPGADLIELSAVDPQLGAVFYTVDQRNKRHLKIEREDHKCLTCHASAKTKGVPGYLVRSVFPAASGHPVYSLGTITTDHTVSLKERFGGWYVSASQDLEHRGNRIVAEADNRNPNLKIPQMELLVKLEDHEEGTDRSPFRVATERYPLATSDLMALMILEHQSQGHNILTSANWDVRRALDYQKVMNQALKRPVDYQSESTVRRIDRAVESIVTYFLFADEAWGERPLPVNSPYSLSFQKLGPFDSEGRSLRELDGNRRMFRYPCSFLIYTDSFRQLPREVHRKVLERVAEILRSNEVTKGFEHLDKQTKSDLDKILLETLEGYPGRK